MSKPLKKLLTGEGVGKLLASKPTMTTRSRREATAAANRGAEEESGSPPVSSIEQQQLCEFDSTPKLYNTVEHFAK